MKRIIVIAVLVFLVCFGLAAESVEDMFSRVMSIGQALKEINISRYHEFIDNVISSMKGPNWSIGLQGAEYKRVDDLKGVEYSLPSLSVSYTTPENDNKFAFEGQLNVGGIQFKSSNEFKAESFSASLKGGLSKVYEFKSWDDTDHTKGLSEQIRKNSYADSVLQVQNEFLEECIKMIRKNAELQEALVSVGYLAAKMNIDTESGALSPDTPEATKRQTEIDVATKNIELLGGEYEKDVEAFKQKYGIDFIRPDACGDYDLTLTVSETGNTDVEAKYAEYLNAEQKIDEKTGRSSTLTLKANVEPEMNFDPEVKYKSTQLKWDVSAGYTIGSLSFDISFNSGYNFPKNPTEDDPKKWADTYVTVSGTWTNTPQVLSDSEIDRLRRIYGGDSAEFQKALKDLSNNALRKEVLELEQLDYAATQAQKEWVASYIEYLSKCSDLQETITAHNREVELLKVKFDGDRKVLAQTEILFDQGKATTDEYVAALAEVDKDEIEELILRINGLILYNRIQMLNR